VVPKKAGVIEDFMKEIELEFRDAEGKMAKHLARIYPNESWTTVVCVDRSHIYNCSSVTSSIEQFASEVVNSEGIPADRVVVIEHYDDLDTYDLIRFRDRRRDRYYEPEWQTISRDEAQKWIGQPVPA
jgi:hypothetical protein